MTFRHVRAVFALHEAAGDMQRERRMENAWLRRFMEAG